MIKIIVAEDQYLIKQAIETLLKQAPDFDVITSDNNNQNFVGYIEISKPDIILLDIKNIKMPGLELTKIIDDRMPWINVISLSMHNHPFYIKEMLKYGAKGFLSRNCSVQELFDGIRNVFNGKTFFCSHCSNILLHEFVNQQANEGIDFRGITTREIEIIGFLANGYTTKEISEKLFISDKTVERHKSNLLGKLKLKNTAQLIKVASENGLLFS